MEILTPPMFEPRNVQPVENAIPAADSNTYSRINSVLSCFMHVILLEMLVVCTVRGPQNFCVHFKLPEAVG